MSYAELFCQSNFSFLQGASHPEELAVQAEFLEYNAIAITDECSVAGVVRAHTAIKEHSLSIKLIVGSYFILDDFHIVLLCPNRDAYAELCRIISNARRRSEKGQYHLDRWDLMSIKHCLCLWLPNSSNNNASEMKNDYWAQWLNKYHKGRSWIACMRHLESNDAEHIQYCNTLSKTSDLPIVACGGVLMHSPNRQSLHHVLTAIRHKTTVEDCQDGRLSNTERALRPISKIAKLYKPEWIQESIRIAERCTFDLSELRYEYPAELVPDNKSAMEHLRDLVKHGSQLRFPEGVPSDIQQTIDKELTLIEELKYPYYFLTIHDLVMFAKRQKILFQGRGSAANSVVCYCLEITSVDPRQISVLFERFISKERDEPPDIDVDFEHERREEVIQYIYGKYGRERTALAATVISYRLKMAIRDVGKALGLHESQLDFFIKNIFRRDRSLNWQSQIMELGLNPESYKGQQFIHLVNEILGFPRHLSQHVGGFVISRGPLYELVPVENAAMEARTVIQWDKDDLESLGLLKVDVLALGMLTAIRKAFSLIQQQHKQSLSIAHITALGDDPDVYKMIQQADTVGVFQIESRAQMSMLPRLKPACYYDLVIQIAIVRPGPIQGDMVHPFLKRRNGEESIDYPSKEVEAVLSRTLGVPIFQEQVIKLAMVAAGFSGGEADQLRRAMASWKKTGKLKPFRDKLINGMQKRGYEAEFAERVYMQICGFGEYGFPESHSASFAVLAYVSAWLKYYYPLEFYAALLNSLPMGFYSASQLIQDAKRHGIHILPTCVNHSQYEHIIEDRKMRLGLHMISGLSESAAQEIIKQRPSKGYQHTQELISLHMTRKDLESLASANALQAISGNRFETRWQLSNQEYALPLLKEQCNHYHLNSEPSEYENLVEDYAATGLTLGKHPLQLLLESGLLQGITTSDQLKNKAHRSLVTVAGVVTAKQAPGTAAGVTFMTLEDHLGNMNVIVWSGTARAQKSAFMTAKILKIKGILEREGDVIHIIAGKLIDISGEIERFKVDAREFH
ncbi:error-prone DNA polymerase [Bermanella marisrubri]|uniref:Error-prone DNA polymerase n=1 Tax=Bermanella marisrubri TaxID=207949 RepID=Q1N4J8_9GAMM|nr:error-prone DNA polymerase [Bermanella marisrubri]EAT13430.1 putative DNA polymerase III alpha chain [Oceanobacter sp. RED65] [Bermanella marisrubri]QIZ84179.1 error-prone DNA polymerase [Bermanella marisrubri]